MIHSRFLAGNPSWRTLFVERGMSWSNSHHKTYRGQTLEKIVALSRERKLNPTYEPQYSEEELRKAAGICPKSRIGLTTLAVPIRSLEPFRFCTTLESISLPFDDPEDVSLLAHLPVLRKLEMG